MVPEVLLVVEGHLWREQVQEEAGDHLVEGVGEAEEASYHREVVGEADIYQRKLAQVEEAEGHQGGQVGGEGLQEQQLSVSEESFKCYYQDYNHMFTTKWCISNYSWAIN